MKINSKYLWILGASLLFCGGAIMAGGSSSSAADPFSTYQNGWVHKSLAFQRTLDMNEPLSKATFISTHNSFNASAYSTWYLFTYLDPNHTYSLTDQFKLDVRMIELDWHWYNGALRLCHGTDSHIGCNISDNRIEDGLSEISNFIRSNRDQVMILYIENKMSGHYSEGVSRLNSYLGDLIYRPTGGCQNVPMNLSKQQILDSGKNILIYNNSCGNSGWSDWVFTQSTIHQKSNGNFGSYPGCGYDRSEYNAYFMRTLEDATTLGGLSGGDSTITTGEMETYMKCGVNSAGLDEISPTDGRLTAAVWSWNSNEPNNYNGNEDCAELYVGSARWNDGNCGNSRAFACTNGDTWQVTDASGAWSGGSSACSGQFGSSFQFGAPRNGYSNQLLNAAAQAKGLSRVWINVSDSGSEGTFVVGGP